MKLTRCGLFLAGAFLLASCFNGTVARADDSAKQATVTIQAPQQVPGSVLPRGTYIFKQTGAQSGWLIVQIYSNDGSALMTTVLAYPNPKLASNGQNFVTYPANGSGSSRRASTPSSAAMPRSPWASWGTAASPRWAK